MTNVNSDDSEGRKAGGAGELEIRITQLFYCLPFHIVCSYWWCELFKKVRQQNIHCFLPFCTYLERDGIWRTLTLSLWFWKILPLESLTLVPQALMNSWNCPSSWGEWTVKRVLVEWQAGVRYPCFTGHGIRKRKRSNETPPGPGNKSMLFQPLTPPGSCKTSWWQHKALVRCISAKHTLHGWVSIQENTQVSWAQRTLPSCPQGEIRATTTEEHTKDYRVCKALLEGSWI